MGENYVYMDDDEMTELQDMLDDMLSEESFSMNALDGATVYADPSPDYLLRVLCTPVLDRCFYLTMWGDRSYEHILHDIKDGTYQGLTMDVFEKKRLEWVKEIKNTEDPILRVEKALRYAREVDVWETKKHFLDLVAKDKTTMVCAEVCANMIKKGYSLTEIAEIVPRTTKADIYGLSHMIKKPLKLTEKEYKAVEKEYRKTGEPAVLKKVFGEPGQKKGKSENV